jgi:arylsulfatase A
MNIKLFLTLLLSLSVTSFATEKPNVIFILADDLGYADVGFHGQKYIKTPHIDKMRSEGMSFSQHYSGSTVCAPSRSCLMTGQHTGHTRVRGNGPGHLLPEDKTVAEIMKGAGYKTACIGKWGLGSYEDEGNPNKKGFDHFFGYISQSRAHHYYQDYLWRNGEKIMYPDNPKKRDHYAHDLFTNEAFEFIKTNKENPFFLYLAYTIPHVDLDVPEESIKPYYHLPEKGPYKGGHYRSCKKPRATFAGMVSHLDRDVGRILALLKELKIAKNTLVIFSSDNGPTSAGGADPDFFNGNGDFRGIKRDLYEGGVRVPFVAWWPGKIKENSTSEHISAFWDLMPTCAELAGVDCPSQSDGVSYLSKLLGKDESQKKHKYLYWEFFERGGKQAIRQGNYKGVRLNLLKNINAPLELYDLSKDPGEKNNIASKYPEVAAELLKTMKNARTESTLYSFNKAKSKKKKKKKKK